MTSRSMLCLLAVLLAAGPVQAQKQFTLLATVTNPAGEPVTTVATSAVHVTENGAAATATKVEVAERSRKLHLLIDSGVGMPPEALADLRKGLQGLVAQVPDGVTISVVGTAPQPRFIERGTTDKARALKAIDLVVPEQGTGRFIESLYELAERIERDKDSFNVVVAVSTAAGDTRVRDGDSKKILGNAASGRMRVHTALYTGRVGSTVGGGGIQQEVGESLSKVSGGRFERFNTPNRLVTLLPELGADVVATMAGGAKQLRITVDRPAGQSGPLGKISISVDGLLVAGVNVESR